MGDREKTNRPFSQISFIEFFVAPLVFATVRVLAPLQGLEEELLQNIWNWMEIWRMEATPPDDEVTTVANRLKRLEEKAGLAVGNTGSPMPSRAGKLQNSSRSNRISQSSATNTDVGGKSSRRDSGSHVRNSSFM